MDDLNNMGFDPEIIYWAHNLLEHKTYWANTINRGPMNKIQFKVQIFIGIPKQPRIHGA